MLIGCRKRLTLLFVLSLGPLMASGTTSTPDVQCADHVAGIQIQNLLFSSYALPLSSPDERAVLLSPSHRQLQRVGPRLHTRDAFAFSGDGEAVYVGYHTTEIGLHPKNTQRSGVHITRFVSRTGQTQLERDNFSLDLDSQSLRRFVVSHDGQSLATGHDPRDDEDAELVSIWHTGSSTYTSTSVEVDDSARGPVVDMLFSADDCYLVVAYELALDIFMRESPSAKFSAKPLRTVIWPRIQQKTEPVLTADPMSNRISVYYGAQSIVLDFSLSLALQGSPSNWTRGFALGWGEGSWLHPVEPARNNKWFPLGLGGKTQGTVRSAYITGELFRDMPVVTVQELATGTKKQFAVPTPVESLAQTEVSPDGRWLATLSAESFCLWSLEVPNHHCSLVSATQSGKTTQFRGVLFSPDGLSIILHRDVVVNDNFVPQIARIPLRTFESIWVRN